MPICTGNLQSSFPSPDRLSSACLDSYPLDPGDAPWTGQVLTGGRGQRYVDWSFRGLRGGWALRPTLPTLQVYAKYYLARLECYFVQIIFD